MLCERYALGRHAEGRRIGRCIGPATACCSARDDQDARSLLRAGAGLWPGSRKKRGRCRPEPSQHSLSPSSTAAPRRGMHHLVTECMEAQSAAAAPASRCRLGTTRPAAWPASWSSSSSTTPISRSGGRSTASAKSCSRRPCRRLTVLTGRAAPARVGAAILRKPVTRAVRRLSRFSWSEARTQHSLELLASQMRRVVAEAAKS
jgi:hypothetical protein